MPLRSARAIIALCLSGSLFLSWMTVRADDESAETAAVAGLLNSSDADALFFLVLPEQPVQGGLEQDGFVVEMPRLAETLLPASSDRSSPARVPVVTVWKTDGGTGRFAGTWQRAERGAPSQFRIAEAASLVDYSSGAVLLFARSTESHSGSVPEFHCRILDSSDERELRILYAHFGLSVADAKPGQFGIHSPWTNRGPPLKSPALHMFLPQFDQISARGFVPTQRSGSTGIGYTLETLLDIPENNSPLGDFLGMELKSHRSGDTTSSASKRMNLFLKEPVWTDGLAHRDRIPKYGYVDDNGRVALYSTLTSRENSHHLRLSVDTRGRRIELRFRNDSVGYWTFDMLQSRLSEKLTETAFVGATSRGAGRDEEFHYDSVLFCQQPAVESLVSLIACREVMVEMRMHVREDGSARNHGSAFRIRQDQLSRLFARTVLVRNGSVLARHP